MKKIIRRPVADKTRDKILKTALKLFAGSGFSGTSTQAIAKAAKVHENLIYHHFGNKEKLWQKVKAYVVEGITLEPLNPEPSSLRDFLTEAVQQRLSAYKQIPEMARLIQWQSMEVKQNELFAGNRLAPIHWHSPLEYLQKQGKIMADIEPGLIIIWLTASVNTLIFNAPQLLRSEKVRQAYVVHLIDGFERALSP